MYMNKSKALITIDLDTPLDPPMRVRLDGAHAIWRVPCQSNEGLWTLRVLPQMNRRLHHCK